MATHKAEGLSPTEAYEELERGDYVRLQFEHDSQCVKVDGVLWLEGRRQPLHVISSRGRRYPLGAGDRVVVLEKKRGY